MLSTNRYPDRGSIGPTPAVTTRADETFLDYIKDLRSVLMYGRSKQVLPIADEAIEASGIKVEPTHESVEAVRELVRREAPDASLWGRIYRSTQEAFWKRIVESYGMKEDAFLQMLDEADKEGPGSITWDPEYIYPAYSKVEQHCQPGGYNGHPLAGLIFDYGTRIFHDNPDTEDYLHVAMAKKVSEPADGEVSKVMDIACSIGSLTCQLKRRFPDAEVWGSDIAAPMVRFAHYRAMQEDLDVHFLQKAAEDLDELPENEFDLVTVHILFHEAPTAVVDRTIANVYRMLRPGGTFWISDFPTLGLDEDQMQYTNYLGTIDSADNCEPFAPEFVRSNLEQKLKDQGFNLRYEDPDDIETFGRVCDKPA